MGTVPQEATRNQYIGNGIEDIYTYSYFIPKAKDIDVYITPGGSPPNENIDIKILNVDYTVQNTGVPGGGTVTFEPSSIPGIGSTVTLIRNVEDSITTDYAQTQNIVGSNLDESFEREMLVTQQNVTNIDEVVLRYQNSAFLPVSPQRNIIPTLDPNFIWKGSAAGGVIAVEDKEESGCSSLRSELANNSQGTDGAALVGYFDENKLVSTDLRTRLNTYGNSLPGQDGARDIGYYDESRLLETSVSSQLNEYGSSTPLNSGSGLIGYWNPEALIATTVKDILDEIIPNIEAGGFVPTGSVYSFASSSVPSGYYECNGISKDIVGPSSSVETIRLFNVIGTEHGNGNDSFSIFNAVLTNVVDYASYIVGTVSAPISHTSGFSVSLINPGSSSTKGVARVEIIVFPPTGGYFEIFSPSGRSSIYWYSVDGVGSAPIGFPGSLVKEISILSTDSLTDIALKTVQQGATQYNLPDCRGTYIRGWDNGRGKDPDALIRLSPDGSTIVGDIVGSTQEDALNNHEHLPASGASQYMMIQGGGGIESGIGSPGATHRSTTGFISATPSIRTSTENRTVNIGLMYIIKN